MGPPWKLWQPPKSLFCICLHSYLYRVSGDSDITCIYPYSCWWGPSLCFCIKQPFLHCVLWEGPRGACFVSKVEPGAGELLLMVISRGLLGWGISCSGFSHTLPHYWAGTQNPPSGPSHRLFTGLNPILSFLFVFLVSASSHNGLLTPVKTEQLPTLHTSTLRCKWAHGCKRWNLFLMKLLS